MKHWILAVFNLASRLGKLCDRVDQEIDAVSCSLTTDTYTLCEAILALSDKKVRLINFKVMGQLMKEKLSDTEFEIVSCRARGATFEEIGNACGLSKSTAARRFQSAVEKCARAAGQLTFTEKKFTDEYKDIPLIYKTVKKFEMKERANF